jgi:hypothetical protein
MCLCLKEPLFPSPERDTAMSPLQQRILKDMQFRGLRQEPEGAYARAGWQPAQYFHRSPEQLSEEWLRNLHQRKNPEKNIEASG